jgi:hypothetical protein
LKKKHNRGASNVPPKKLKSVPRGIFKNCPVAQRLLQLPFQKKQLQFRKQPLNNLILLCAYHNAFLKTLD